MPRRKLSEYRSKRIIHEALGLPYEGWTISAATASEDMRRVTEGERYVVKVDQAVKGRFKRGLVALDVPREKLGEKIAEYTKEGFAHFIIEPYVSHEAGSERYLSVTSSRSGLLLRFSSHGGVDIEARPESIEEVALDDTTDWAAVAARTGLTETQLRALMEAYRRNHFTFLEINPYLAEKGTVRLLDLAVEVDDAGLDHASGWTKNDLREPKKALAAEEEAVHALDQGSAASFNLSVINPDGAIFLLLSGGGASVVIADEIYNKGLGSQLANYGEYSGNPQAHEVQKYTGEVLKLLVHSAAPKKVLFIGGAVANFTDIATTFSGVIAALRERAGELQRHDVKIYVRRGGPRQETGLENMRRALESMGVMGGVYGPETPLTDALGAALEGIER
jgi:succinyl-CoA synthetase beta subunit